MPSLMVLSKGGGSRSEVGASGVDASEELLWLRPATMIYINLKNINELNISEMQLSLCGHYIMADIKELIVSSSLIFVSSY